MSLALRFQVLKLFPVHFLLMLAMVWDGNCCSSHRPAHTCRFPMMMLDSHPSGLISTNKLMSEAFPSGSCFWWPWCFTAAIEKQRWMSLLPQHSLSSLCCLDCFIERQVLTSEWRPFGALWYSMISLPMIFMTVWVWLLNPEINNVSPTGFFFSLKFFFFWLFKVLWIGVVTCTCNLSAGSWGGMYLRASLGYIERPCLKKTKLTQNSNVKSRLRLYINLNHHVHLDKRNF